MEWLQVTIEPEVSRIEEGEERREQIFNLTVQFKGTYETVDTRALT